MRWCARNGSKPRLEARLQRNAAMTLNGWLQIALYCVIVTLLVKPFGGYMTKVFSGERHIMTPVFRWLERGIYAICGVNEKQEQHWVTYAVAMLFFTAA